MESEIHLIPGPVVFRGIYCRSANNLNTPFSWLQMKNILFAREITGQYRQLLKCAKKIRK